MPWNTKIKLEPRGDEDPKFDPHNKTDRKILIAVVVSSIVIIGIIVGLFCIYYFGLHKYENI